jgi:hypothetical protein
MTHGLRLDLRPADRRLSRRAVKDGGFPVRIASEFKTRAHMHVPPHAIPGDELTWLALILQSPPPQLHRRLQAEPPLR